MIQVIITVGSDRKEWDGSLLKTKKQRELKRFIHKHAFFIRPHLNHRTAAKILRRLPKGSFQVSGGVIRYADKSHELAVSEWRVWVLPKGFKYAIVTFGGLANYTRPRHNHGESIVEGLTPLQNDEQWKKEYDKEQEKKKIDESLKNGRITK